MVPVGTADIVDAYLVRACATAPAIERDVQRRTVLIPRENKRGAKGFFEGRSRQSERIVSARYSFIGIR